MSSRRLRDWDIRYPDDLPVAHRMTGREEWLRFHSLPESKRYADTQEEKAIILDRHNQLAREVLGDGTDCLMTYWCMIDPSRFSAKSRKGTCHWEKRTAQTLRKYKMKFARFIDLPQDEEQYWIYATTVIWREGRYNSVLTSVARDFMRVIWMSRRTGAIFAPYDGGVDLILPDPAQKEKLKKIYADWLSPWDHGF